jgi:hypothetical protein
MSLHLVIEDLKSYSNKDLNILKKYYNISDDNNDDNLIWLIATNIHSTKMNMAPDKIWSKYNDKLIPLLPPKLIENDAYKQLFLDADPTIKKKNLEWIIKSFINGGYNINELSELKLAIVKFNKLKEKSVIKNNLDNFGGLHGFNRNNTRFPSLINFLNKYIDKDIDYKFNIIEDNSNVKIIQLLNKQASYKFGENTKWCIAGKEYNNFDKYYKEGELYIIIPKNPTHTGEKYQLYITSNYINNYNKNILVDENDNPININNLISKYPYLKNNSLLKYTLLRLKGLKMSYKQYIESTDNNLIYKIKDGKHEFKDGTYWYKNKLLHKIDGPAIEKINGDKEWYKNGILHRVGGPAIERANGDKYWYRDGLLHRIEGGPAIDEIDGYKAWYKDGRLHRIDGPAIDYLDKHKEWYQYGELHREDGPAIEDINGNKKWYKDGNLHRIDGPAFITSNGDNVWYQNGLLHRMGGPAVERVNRDKKWYQNGRLHRIDGPAIENADGQEWYLNGKLHRINGPAIVKSNGDKKWYQNGILYRIDGPAIELSDGTKEWYKDGKLHRIDGPAVEKNEGTNWYKNGILHRSDGPAIELKDGTKEWVQNGVRHRLDGPAIELPNGDKWWYQNGKLHRIDGPAIDLANGDKWWYQDGNLINNE